jgi:hypothetical protein
MFWHCGTKNSTMKSLDVKTPELKKRALKSSFPEIRFVPIFPFKKCVIYHKGPFPILGL